LPPVRDSGPRDSAAPPPDNETATVERIPDPNVPEFGAEWDAAWEKNLLTQALERAKTRIDERQFQVFDLCVSKGWPAADVAKTLGISTARVYLTKHRISALVKQEVERLQREIERSLQTRRAAP
jgi:DNA-directed RNA polymerase specialized sigma24 family protein